MQIITMSTLSLAFSALSLMLTSPSSLCHALLSSTLAGEHRYSLVPRRLLPLQRNAESSFVSNISQAAPLSTRGEYRSRDGTTRLYAGGGENAEEQHLQGIGVGIDLGTTNSAVAMMIPADDDDFVPMTSRRTVPTMIEIDDDGRTIPSVVSFVPTSDEEEQPTEHATPHSPSLPPWTSASDHPSEILDIQWPALTPDGDPYQIHIGKRAIEYEQHHPNNTFRNVKRIIGTGGRMAELAAGVVPNLYIHSVDGNGNDGFGDSLDAFDALDAEFGGKKGKKKKKKQHVSKWKKKKAAELPKLQKQLEQARDDPALLSCGASLPRNVAGGSDDASNIASEEVRLRPEQISACVLRKLYDTAERHHHQLNRRRNGSDDENGERAKVTRAVIGVPAYFTESQRRATVRASELAGVAKVKLLPEPEAAALAYGAASDDSGVGDEEELILVFDLGGGTFDVSVLEVGGGVTEVLATVGNNRLGGTDFDRRVAEYLSARAVEYGRKSNAESKNKNKNNSLENLEDAVENETDGGRRKRIPVKDWYREGKGEVPDIILRTAEEARKCLSNQKIVEVLVPFTEGGWRRVDNLDSVIGPFDDAKLESQHNLCEGQDYTVVRLDRKTFESICYAELQMLLQPIREVAIMAGVLLPGEARPSFVENAMAMATMREDEGQDFWEFENEFDTDDDEKQLLIKTDKDGLSMDSSAEEEEELLNEQALQQIQAMDVKAQKKAQQRGRKKSRDIAKRERSFRKQKQSAMEEATTASLLGTQLDGSSKKQKRANNAAATQQQPVSAVGNERVQDGIHGRPLSRIVLVGGATRTPVVAKLLEAVAGMVPQRTVHPDEAVALGCAVQAGILDGENDGLANGMQAVLSPMQAAVMRALAKKRGMDGGDMMAMEGGMDGGAREAEMMMMGGGGISGMIVDEFDDEDDFY